MKVHAYQVVAQATNVRAFQMALQSIWDLPQQDRLGTLGRFGIRLEHLREHQGLFEMEFSRPMYQDLGRLSMSTPLNPIVLEHREDFGTYTAAVYDPISGYLFLQHNQAGARVGFIRDYLSSFSGSNYGYNLNVKLKDGVTSDSIIGRDIPKLKIGISPKHLTAADRAQGHGLIDALMAISDSLDGDSMVISISCRTHKGTDLQQAKAGLDQDALEEIAAFGDYIKMKDPRAFRPEFLAREGRQAERNVTEDVLSYLGKKWVHEEVLTESEGERKFPLNSKLEIIYRGRTSLNGGIGV